MIFILFPIVTVIGVILYDHYVGFGTDEITVVKSILFGLLSIVVALLLCLITPAIFDSTEIISTETYEITAVSDNFHSESTSAFIIATCEKEKLCYNYMYKDENKGYGCHTVEANRSYINYTNDTPHIIINKYTYESDFLKFLMGKTILNTEYIFYLPENAEVINDFVIDFN